MRETKKELREKLMNAELRACRHFTKLTTIEKIVENADKNKELYVDTINKIKKELANTEHC